MARRLHPDMQHIWVHVQGSLPGGRDLARDPRTSILIYINPRGLASSAARVIGCEPASAEATTEDGQPLQHTAGCPVHHPEVPRSRWYYQTVEAILPCRLEIIHDGMHGACALCPAKNRCIV